MLYSGGILDLAAYRDPLIIRVLGLLFLRYTSHIYYYTFSSEETTIFAVL